MDFESECTIIIPLRIDTADRLLNLRAVTKYLRTCFPYIKILVLESDDKQRVSACSLFSHVFVPSNERFRKGCVSNYGVSLATTPYVIIYDCDVFVAREAILLSWREKEDADIVFPHNRLFVKVHGSTRAKLLTEDAIEFDRVSKLKFTIGQECNQDLETYSYLSTGGIVMFRTTVFKKFRGFNQHMISYGYEDEEIVTRFLKMGCRMKATSDWNGFHIEHARGIDSRSNEFYDTNRIEFEKVRAMSQLELQLYIDTCL